MHIIHKLSKALIILTALFSFALSAAPENFYQAKIDYKRHVYFDRTDEGTIYCGCNWRWKGRSGGVVDLKSCGYEGNSMHNRAKRIEAEHIYPASHMGSQRQCWQNGGRKNCNKTDPVFNAMEADLHNLAPSVGAINARRSNYNFGQLPQIENQFGACDFKVDASTRIAEPRDKVKGMVARVSFYMVDRYDLSMSKQQQQLFIAWNKMYPVTPWEKERDHEQLPLNAARFEGVSKRKPKLPF